MSDPVVVLSMSVGNETKVAHSGGLGRGALITFPRCHGEARCVWGSSHSWERVWTAFHVLGVSSSFCTWDPRHRGVHEPWSWDRTTAILTGSLLLRGAFLQARLQEGTR